jgi:5-methyltetrahydropteroyltriglutamate--homocysteine methyltransferase
MPNLHSDVVGSLLRPGYLLQARDQLERGELTPPAFKVIEDRAVLEAVQLQQAAGLDLVTDGELRRYAFFGHLVDALEGFNKYSGWSITFRDNEATTSLSSVPSSSTSSNGSARWPSRSSRSFEAARRVR